MKGQQPRPALEGSRIRERRSLLGLRQADVARSVGVSPAYLNLIEHNRRRIRPELLDALARVLSTEVSALAEGGERTVLDGLRTAAVSAVEQRPEMERLEEFAGRFPGWAATVADQARRIATLERLVETLNDRMAHDPFLPAALHEMLSSVTSIRSTAAILAESRDLEAEWSARFHANLQSDSERLALSARSLVQHLDALPSDQTRPASPLEAIDKWLAANEQFEMALSQGAAAEALIADADLPSTALAPALGLLEQRRRDVALLPRQVLERALAEGRDPLAIATRLGLDLGLVLRRIAAAPWAGPSGLLICDAAGVAKSRQSIEGFPMPSLAPPCPLWPIFRALGRPGQPIHAVVEPVGRLASRFTVWAHALRFWPEGLDGPEVVEAVMLIRPATGAETAGRPAEPVGTSCAICPRSNCAARRAPSALTEAPSL